MSLSVITFHYVREIKNSKYPNIKGLEFTEFKDQINYLVKNYEIISPEDLINKDFNSKKKNVILTFDDGLVDHYKYVYPFLKKKNISGSFYPAVESSLHKTILDVHKLQFILEKVQDRKLLLSKILKMVKLKGINVDYYLEIQKDLTKANDLRFNDNITNIIRNLLQYILPLKISSSIGNQLFKKYVSINNKNFMKELYLSEKNIKEMIENKMHFGSHGNKHVWLQYLDKEQQYSEVSISKKFLIDNGVDENYLSICYPFGSYNKTTIDVIKKLNFKIAYTTNDPKVKSPYKNLSLPRYDTNDFKKFY